MRGGLGALGTVFLSADLGIIESETAHQPLGDVVMPGIQSFTLTSDNEFLKAEPFIY